MSIEFQSHFDIAAPPERVIAAMTNTDQWGEWMDGLIRVEMLTDGTYGTGTRWRETRKIMGKEATEEFEVIDFQPPERIELRVDGTKGSTGKGEFRFVYTLTPDGAAGTHLEVDAGIHMPGAFAGVFARLFKGMFKKACDRDTAALKAWVEKEATSAAPSSPSSR